MAAISIADKVQEIDGWEKVLNDLLDQNVADLCVAGSNGADSKSGNSSDDDVADGQTSFFENENLYAV